MTAALALYPYQRAILDALAEPGATLVVRPTPASTGADLLALLALVCGIPDAKPCPDATPTAPARVWHPCHCGTGDTLWHGGDTPDPLRGLPTPLPAPMEGGGGVP